MSEPKPKLFEVTANITVVFQESRGVPDAEHAVHELDALINASPEVVYASIAGKHNLARVREVTECRYFYPTNGDNDGESFTQDGRGNIARYEPPAAEVHPQRLRFSDKG